MDITITTIGALIGLALATMILTAVGVFGDVAVITVAPIAMVIGQRIGCSNFILLAALMGGEKAGMVISPNPNPMGLPSIGSAIIGPLVAVVLLMLRPICGITVDPLIALPAGATASSSAGATIASATFSETITQIVPALIL